MEIHSSRYELARELAPWLLAGLIGPCILWMTVVFRLDSTLFIPLNVIAMFLYPTSIYIFFATSVASEFTRWLVILSTVLSNIFIFVALRFVFRLLSRFALKKRSLVTACIYAASSVTVYGIGYLFLFGWSS